MLGRSPINHIKRSNKKKSPVIKPQPASKPLNFAELFGKSTTANPHKKLTGAAPERISPLNFDSINMDGLSPRLTAPGMANLLQINSNHIAPSLSSFSNMGKTPRSELARKESINGLLSIFSQDFATKVTNISGEKSLLKLEKSSENEKDELIPSIEWQGNESGKVLAPVKAKTFFDIGSSICEEIQVQVQAQAQEKTVRRSREPKEAKQKRTRSSSMGTLRAIHQEEILNKRDFPSLAALRYPSLFKSSYLSHYYRSEIPTGKEKKSSQDPAQRKERVPVASQNLVESPFLRGYQSDTTSRNSRRTKLSKE